MLKNATIFENSNLVDDFKQIAKKVGRPPKTDKKIAISIRLSPKVINHFKKQGANWRSRINDALEQVAKDV